MTTGLDRGSIALLVVGTLLVIGAFLLYPGTTAVTHYTEVTAVEAADARGSERLYEFENLSSRGKDVFLEALNTTGRVPFEGKDNRPPDFQYYDDTSWRGFVEYDGTYYRVSGTREDCLGLSCVTPHLQIGAMVFVGALALGYGFQRGLRR